MTRGLVRFHESGQSHFVTFSCFDRRPYFTTPDTYDLFVRCLEDMRQRFEMRIYGYVLMPEHVHLLISEPPHTKLADALHYLKLSFAKRLNSRRREEESGGFWQKRYHDRNVRDYREFTNKLRYLRPSEGWFNLLWIGGGAAIVTMRCGRQEWLKSNRSGRPEIENKKIADEFSLTQVSAQPRARTWGTRLAIALPLRRMTKPAARHPS